MYCLLIGLLVHNTVLYDFALLGIQEGVSKDNLFLLQIFGEAFRLERELVEIERERSKASVAEPMLELLQLLNEGAPDLQILPPGV